MGGVYVASEVVEFLLESGAELIVSTRRDSRRTLRNQNSRRLVTALLAIALLLIFNAGISSATQGGTTISTGCCGTGVDLGGTKANFTAPGWTAGKGFCVIYSVVGSSAPAGEQIETGEYNCNAYHVDGCPTGTNGFTEVSPSAGSFTCFYYGAVTVGATYTFDVHDDGSAPPSSWIGYINGNWFHTVTGFHTSVDTTAWAETISANDACSGWYASLNVTSWQRYWLADNSWHIITSNVPHYQQTTGGCFTVGSLGSGTFSVHN